jgi:hypothetical protein
MMINSSNCYGSTINSYSCAAVERTERYGNLVEWTKQVPRIFRARPIFAGFVAVAMEMVPDCGLTRRCQTDMPIGARFPAGGAITSCYKET